MRYLITIPGLAACVARGGTESEAIAQACDMLGLEPADDMQAVPYNPIQQEDEE